MKSHPTARMFYPTNRTRVGQDARVTASQIFSGGNLGTAPSGPPPLPVILQPPLPVILQPPVRISTTPIAPVSPANLLNAQNLLQQIGIYQGVPNGVDDAAWADALHKFQYMVGIQPNDDYIGTTYQTLHQYARDGYVPSQPLFLIGGIPTTMVTPGNAQKGDVAYIDWRRVGAGVGTAPSAAYPYAIVDVSDVSTDKTKALPGTVLHVQGHVRAFAQAPLPSSPQVPSSVTTQLIGFSPYQIVGVDRGQQRVWDPLGLGPAAAATANPTGTASGPIGGTNANGPIGTAAEQGGAAPPQNTNEKKLIGVAVIAGAVGLAWWLVGRRW